MSEILNHIIFGALVDYTIWLKKREPRIDVSGIVVKFFEAEGLDYNIDPDYNWKHRCSSNVEKELCDRFSEGACVVTETEDSTRIRMKLGEKEIDSLLEALNHANTKRIIVN